MAKDRKIVNFKFSKLNFESVGVIKQSSKRSINGAWSTATSWLLDSQDCSAHSPALLCRDWLLVGQMQQGFLAEGWYKIFINWNKNLKAEDDYISLFHPAVFFTVHIYVIVWTHQCWLRLHDLPGEPHRGCPGSEATLPLHPAWPFWSRALLQRTTEAGRWMNEGMKSGLTVGFLWSRALLQLKRVFAASFHKCSFSYYRWNGWKLTGVCFIIPDEPLSQKPDDQSWKETRTLSDKDAENDFRE